MPKKSKGKHRLDKFYHLAKEQGYRSRAAFKLIQLNRKYDFLSKARSCLDLCAAPGGWLQIAQKYMPMNSLIVGVDLAPIQAIRGVQTFVEDITTPACRSKIKKMANGSLFDVVLHDGAPNVGGAWSSEASMQTYLVLESLRLGTEFLSPNGTFVTKIFRSQDYTALLYAFKQLFHKVEATKPLASRSQSAEIFVVCQHYKAPAKIDPRLLDAKSVFANLNEISKVPSVLDDKAGKRNRQGYEDGVTVLYKEVPVWDFIKDEHPIELLGQVNKLLFNGEGDGYDVMMGHKDTTEELQECCADLKVLGKREFKQLIKWRVGVVKALAAKEKAAKAEVEEPEAELEEEEEDEELKLLEEMGEVKELIALKRKQKKKKDKKVKKKSRERAAMGMQGAAGEGDTIYSAEADLFSLKSVTGKTTVKKAGPGRPGEEVEAEAEPETSDDSDSGGEDEGPQPGDSDYDSDEARAAHHSKIESALDVLYEHYKGGKTGKVRERRRRARLGQGEMSSDEEDGASEDEDDGAVEALGQGSYGDKAKNGLIVDLAAPRRAQGADLASQWFSQDMFEGAEDDAAPRPAPAGKRKRAAGDVDADSDEDEGMAEPRVAAGAARAGAGVAAGAGAGGGLVREDEGERMMRLAAEKNLRRKERSGEMHEQDFEEVPMEADKDSDYSSDSSRDSGDESDGGFDPEGMGDRERAEIKTYGRAMLDAKRKDAMMDDAYNRYTFHDEGLPRWFVDEERRHMRPQKPVTKQEVQEAMDELKAIDARPLKKVAEAKARKKFKAAKKLEQATSRANKIADQEEMGARSKAQEIEKIMARAAAQSKNKQKDAMKLIRAKKGQTNGRGKTVDKRMLADKRGEKARAKKAGGKKGSKGGGGRPGRMNGYSKKN